MRTKLLAYRAAMVLPACCYVVAVSGQELTIVSGSGPIPGLEQITYGNGSFLALGGTFRRTPTGVAALSPDGLTWSVRTPAGNAIVGEVLAATAGRSNFVAVGNRATYFRDPAGTNGFIQASSDGLAWDRPRS